MKGKVHGGDAVDLCTNFWPYSARYRVPLTIFIFSFFFFLSFTIQIGLCIFMFLFMFLTSPSF